MESKQNGSRGVWASSAALIIILVGGALYFLSTNSTQQSVVEQPQSIPPLDNTDASASTSRDLLLNSNQAVGVIATSTFDTEAKATSPISSASSTAIPPISTTKIASKPTASAAVVPSSVSQRGDWGTVRSAIGYTLQYPYKEIGAMWGGNSQVVFFFPSSVIAADASTSDKLGSDIHNIDLYGGLNILPIKATTTSVDFDDWIKAYHKKEDSRYGNDEKVLSEQVEKTQFAGLESRRYSRQLEGDKYQNSPHYARIEIFARNSSVIYLFSYLAPSEDTVFPRSGLAGKKYLTYVQSMSEKVLQTFMFDKSKVNSITVPKNPPEILTGAAKERREKLLTTLRTGVFYDPNTFYPEESDICIDGTSENASGTRGSLSPASGLFIAADDESADMHAYDTDGFHTGPVPTIPGFGAPIEEQARGIDSINLGSAGYGLSIQEMIDGRIELAGKKLNQIYLRINGDGNSCTIASLPLYVTPRTIATLPITAKGDIGPISYDVDGDGVQDMEISLLHPLTKQKEIDLREVLEDMMKTNNWTFSN